MKATRKQSQLEDISGIWASQALGCFREQSLAAGATCGQRNVVYSARVRMMKGSESKIMGSEDPVGGLRWGWKDV